MLLSRYLLVAAVVAFASALSAAHAGTIHVDDDTCPGPGGGTEGDPYCSIQTAIDNAVDTDEIVVAPGTYFEAIDLQGKAINLHSSGGAVVTTIDATGLDAPVVTCMNGEGPDTILGGGWHPVTTGDDEAPHRRPARRAFVGLELRRVEELLRQ